MWRLVCRRLDRRNLSGVRGLSAAAVTVAAAVGCASAVTAARSGEFGASTPMSR